MKIEKMRLKNFRCFGNAVTELEFDQILTTPYLTPALKL